MWGVELQIFEELLAMVTSLSIEGGKMYKDKHNVEEVAKSFLKEDEIVHRAEIGYSRFSFP